MQVRAHRTAGAWYVAQLLETDGQTPIGIGLHGTQVYRRLEGVARPLCLTQPQQCEAQVDVRFGQRWRKPQYRVKLTGCLLVLAGLQVFHALGEVPVQNRGMRIGSGRFHGLLRSARTIGLR